MVPRWHASLGATIDFHDELIEFSYERQLELDPSNTPYYLDCLQGIAGGRHSEALDTKVAIEASENKISLKDVRAAFRELGLDPRAHHEDDVIIGTFKSRISDAPKQEAAMRRALKIIGQSRESEKIQLIASQGTITTAMKCCLANEVLNKSQLSRITSKRFSIWTRPRILRMTSSPRCTL